MEEVVVPLIAITSLFIGMPWVILHYMTKWKQAPRITQEDENLLDDLYQTARRLEERLITVERIIAADNPDFRLHQSPHAPTASEIPSYDPLRRN